MLKNNRSMSLILQKHPPMPDSNRTPLPSNQQPFIPQSTQLAGSPFSNLNLLLGETRQKSKSFLTSSGKTKSSSCSKIKIFSQAHQVKKGETFQKIPPQTVKSNLCLSASNKQLIEYKKNRKEVKLQEVIDKKMIISKVLTSMEDESKPKLTIRSEMQRKKHISAVSNGQYLQNPIAQSRTPQSLVFSKDLENESLPNFFHRQPDQSKIKNPSSISIDEETLKNYNKELVESLHATIRKEMKEQYLAKQKELQQRYSKKQEQYLEKFKSLEQVMETKLEKERAIIMKSIESELQKQFERVKIETEKEEKSQAKREDVKVKEKDERKSSVNFKQQNFPQKIKQPSQRNSYEVSNGRKYSRQAQGSEELQSGNIVQRSIKSPSLLPQESIKSKPSDTSKKQEKAAKVPAVKHKSKSIYEKIDDQILEDIEEIDIGAPKKQNKPTTANTKEKDRVNKSFNFDNRNNDSFSSEKHRQKEHQPPKIKKEPSQEERRRIQEQELKKKQEEERRRKDEEKRRAEEEQRIKLEQRKAFLRESLSAQSKKESLQVFLGETAGYCSKLCKKSKINWKTPSILLYRYCLDLFRKEVDTYQQAERLGVIKAQQLDNFISYDKLMQQNMIKMYNSFRKKITFRDVYCEIIESQEIQLERLRPYIFLQVKNYVQELKRSPESNRKSADITVLQGALRIINSVFIIKKFNGENTEIITEDINELTDQRVFELFQQWSEKLLREK